MQELIRSGRMTSTRRNGTAETVATVFPETGGITYSPRWVELKRASGCNVDNGKNATDFRRFLKERGIARDATNIEKLFSDYCGASRKSAEAASRAPAVR